MARELAYFKSAPSKAMPIRPGPIQCVRNCTRCILKPVLDDDPQAEEIIAVRSYEDLVQRQSLWLTPYQTVQYHLGQVDLLKRATSKTKPKLLLYIVALTSSEDSSYLDKVLKHERLPTCEIINDKSQTLSVTKSCGSFLIPIHMPSCSTSSVASSCDIFNVRQLRDFLSPIIDHYAQKQPMDGEENSAIAIPVAITKDHGRMNSILGVGSLCIQILEPYSLKDYVENLKTQHKTGHLVQHLYHDLAMNNSKLATHIVAFLLLFLDRPEGISRQDLVEYMDWLRKSSMELNLHTGFTGVTELAIEFGLRLLANYIHYDKKARLYWPVDTVALMCYANIIVPNIAYYGVISRAILMLHNREDQNTVQVKFTPNVVFRVMKDDLLELSQDLAESIDLAMPCRPPCLDVQSCVIDAFSRMETFGHYFRTQDALIRQNAGRVWAGDFDSDDEYYRSKRDDPAFKPWIILTKRPYRIDRLNLFMNAIEPYLANDSI